ncbi:MAG: ribosome-associated translation inhibitor RaiA [Ignavibacteriales bacterium]|nr:ribosome-associated translation inhibitor RaiA [Ignavibacteriales bacterium]
MDIHFTARRFKPHQDIRDHALSAIKKLDKYYDGIVRSDIILSYEGKNPSLKATEIKVKVVGAVLSAKEKSDDFHKSIDMAMEKSGRQLDKYKSKLRMKNKKTLRKVKEKENGEDSGDE